MNLNNLIEKIVIIDDSLRHKATSAINSLLTMRNWLIGYYIVEYEQAGEEKAKYNTKLINNLSEKLKSQNIQNMNPRELRRIRLFYKTYSYLDLILSENAKRGTLPPVFENNEINNLLLPLFKDNSKRGTASPVLENNSIQDKNLEEKNKYRVPSEKLITNLSYSHFIELIKIEDDLKRTFYEVECMKGTWNVRELKRQINSLYFERSGLSTNKEKLSSLANENVKVCEANSSIKNQFVFEFLNIPANETLEEQALEKGLMDNLQSFLLELGYGFCFESRQKRILIDDEYFYIDLVFYHRILKCHVIIELKTEEFNYNNMGQLNTYLQYYKDKMMEDGDNLPIGILLCTDSKPQMVKYALADKENMYVSQFKLQLPSEKELEKFINEQIAGVKNESK